MIHFANGRTSLDSGSAPARAAPAHQYGAPPGTRESIEKWIGDHPVVSIAAALILGAALGWLIKRR